VDPFYAGFNLSVLQDPTLQSRVCEQDLFCLVYRAVREIDGHWDLLADTFYCTLSERATGMFGREVRHVTHKECSTPRSCSSSKSALHFHRCHAIGGPYLAQLLDREPSGRLYPDQKWWANARNAMPLRPPFVRRM